MVQLEDIYDAAFNKALFPALIERLVRAFDAKAGFLAWSDTARGAGFQAEFGNDPRWLQSYVDTYAQHDIMRGLLHAVPEGECTTAWPHLQTQVVRDSIFYREYLAPQGIVDNLAVNLIKRPGIVAHLALLRCEPSAPFSREECDRLSPLLPHLRRTVYIQSHLVRAADHAASVHAFSGANGYVILLAADRTIAEIDLPLGSLLRLRLGDGLGEGPLGKAVQDAIEQGHPVAVELTSGDDAPIRLLIEARPLEQNQFGDLATGPAPTHAIHIAILDQPRSIAFDAMASLYRLTPTELRVLRDAMRFGDMVTIGDRLGMARATARTHLHRIYDKTDTGSISRLSNLVHRFARLTPE
ncbi:MAG: hypothetical protein ABW039_08095 [Sphingobium sp.]